MRPAPIALALSLAAASAIAAENPPTAQIQLKNAAGASVGSATLRPGPGGVLLRVEVKGLAPGWHGLHFHETGDCSKSDFTSAGAHVHGQPNKVHGLLNPDFNEAGDLPNLFVGADGVGAAEVFSSFVTLTGGNAGAPALADADGSALVIHANPDDYMSQPIGGAGARIACGVISGQ